MVQNFKGDDTELKMQAVAEPAMTVCSNSLDAYFAGAYSASDFLLAVYDAGRMPFSERVPRDSFVDFFNQALQMFPFTGTFESYCFILKSIFGEESEILFEVTAPGKLQITVDSEALLNFDWILTERVDGVDVVYEMVTSDGYTLGFTGIPGIDSQSKIEQLISELIPNGIVPIVIFEQFDVSNFVANDDMGVLDSVVDTLGNQIVFFELID